MWRLHQFPLCPFSRKVRLLLGEKAIPYDLVREHPWRQDDAFLDLNPAGRTPVLVDSAHGMVLADSRAICEYVEETGPKPSLLNGPAPYRAEVRRLVAWFDEQFFGDVTAPLLQERMIKRLVLRQPPDAGMLREAMRRANTHLDYVDYLIDNRNWLAGTTMSLADLAAAAQISVADYLGGLDWRGHEQTRDWYMRFKSRPSFRPILAERMEVIVPPKHYEEPDF